MPTIGTRHTRKRGCGWRKGGGLYLVSDAEPRPCGIFPVELCKCPTCGAGVKPTRGWSWIDPRPFVAQRLAGRGVAPGVPAKTCALGMDCDVCYEKWGQRCGLLWIGGAYYETPREFLDEARRMGISRRIPAVPKDIIYDQELEELVLPWVLLAHRKCIPVKCPTCEGRGWSVPSCPSRVGPVARLVAAGTEGLPAAGGDVRTWGPKCETCMGGGIADWKPGIFAAFKPTAIEYVVKGNESEDKLQRLFERGVELVKDVRVEDQGSLPVQQGVKQDA